MDSQIKKQSILQRAIAWTGLFPAISCWGFVIYAWGDRKFDSHSLGIVSWLALISIMMFLFSRRHFKKTEAKMWIQNPAMASVKWMGMNILVGYLLLAVPAGIYSFALGDFNAALGAFVYLLFSIVPAFPGIAIGFFVHTQALANKDGFSYRKLLCCRAA